MIKNIIISTMILFLYGCLEKTTIQKYEKKGEYSVKQTSTELNIFCYNLKYGIPEILNYAIYDILNYYNIDHGIKLNVTIYNEYTQETGDTTFRIDNSFVKKRHLLLKNEGYRKLINYTFDSLDIEDVISLNDIVFDNKEIIENETQRSISGYDNFWKFIDKCFLEENNLHIGILNYVLFLTFFERTKVLQDDTIVDNDYLLKIVREHKVICEILKINLPEKDIDKLEKDYVRELNFKNS